MPSSISNYAEAALVNHLGRVATYTAPTFYMGIADGLAAWDPETGVLTGTEPFADPDYARVPVTWEPATGPVAGYLGGVQKVYAELSGELVFPGPSEFWGVAGAVSLAMFDDPTAGNMFATWQGSVGGTGASSTSEIRWPVGSFRIYLDRGEQGAASPTRFTNSTFDHQKAMLDLLLRGDAYQPDLWLGLLDSGVGSPDPATPGTYTEFTKGGYARQDISVLFDTAISDGNGGMECLSNADVYFGPASENWPAPGGKTCIFDAGTAGDLVFTNCFANTSGLMTTGDRSKSAAGNIRLRAW